MVVKSTYQASLEKGNTLQYLCSGASSSVISCLLNDYLKMQPTFSLENVANGLHSATPLDQMYLVAGVLLIIDINMQEQQAAKRV